MSRIHLLALTLLITAVALTWLHPFAYTPHTLTSSAQAIAKLPTPAPHHEPTMPLPPSSNPLFDPLRGDAPPDQPADKAPAAPASATLLLRGIIRVDGQRKAIILVQGNGAIKQAELVYAEKEKITGTKYRVKEIQESAVALDADDRLGLVLKLDFNSKESQQRAQQAAAGTPTLEIKGNATP